MNISMSLDTFAELVDRHGGDLQRWPADAATAARILLASSQSAGALLARQQQLDALLGASAAALPAPSARLRAVILAAAPRPRAPSLWTELWQLLGGVRIAGPAFAAALMLGLALGNSLGWQDSPAVDDEDLVALAQLSDDYLAY